MPVVNVTIQNKRDEGIDFVLIRQDDPVGASSVEAHRIERLDEINLEVGQVAKLKFYVTFHSEDDTGQEPPTFAVCSFKFDGADLNYWIYNHHGKIKANALDNNRLYVDILPN